MSWTPNYVKRLKRENASGSPETMRAIEALEQDPPCPIPWEHILLEATGEVHICCQSSATIGNINQNTLEEIWNGDRAHHLREHFLNHEYPGCSLRCNFILDRVKQGKKISAADDATVDRETA